MLKSDGYERVASENIWLVIGETVGKHALEILERILGIRHHGLGCDAIVGKCGFEIAVRSAAYRTPHA